MLKLFLVVIYILVNSDKLFGANYFTILIKRKREGRLRKPPKNDCFIKLYYLSFVVV